MSALPPIPALTVKRAGFFRGFGLLAGPLLAALLFILVPESIEKNDGTELHLGTAGRITAGMTVWMALWWILETIPLYITALLPLIILPLSGEQSMITTAVSYSHPVVYLALGGFVLGAALEKWQLHKRFAQFTISIVGNGPRRIVAGFMLACAALSMWISNVATAIIMLPVALSIINLQHKDGLYYHHFALCLLLGICYSCSVGGMGTLIGTGPNMFFAAYMEAELLREISFVKWMAIAVPVIIVFLPIIWWVLTRIIFFIPASAQDMQLVTPSKAEDIPWSRGAVLTLAVFATTALAWMLLPLLTQWQPLQHLSVTGIALLAMLVLFITPAKKYDTATLMDWNTAVHKVPWGVLLLIGGGLSLAKAVSRFGVGELLAYQLLALTSYSPLIIIVAVVALMVFLTEISSNIASVTALTPIFAAMAISMDMDPVTLIIPITLAASCAFMLPVATPTNTVVFGSGLIRSRQMARAGFLLNLVAIVIISLWTGFFPAF